MIFYKYGTQRRLWSDCVAVKAGLLSRYGYVQFMIERERERERERDSVAVVHHPPGCYRSFCLHLFLSQ